MAALSVSWETLDRITPAEAPVVTGMSAEDQPKPEALVIDRPILVWVTDEGEGFDKIAEVIFKKENVALGAKAFRAVKMAGHSASEEPLLAGKGTEIPRILLVDATRDVTVLEKNKLSAGTVWTAMKKAASEFYAEDLDKIVKEHLKILTELDKASNEDKVLAQKEEKLATDDSGKKELEKVRKEREDVKARLEELQERQAKIWKLTAKPVKS